MKTFLVTVPTVGYEIWEVKAEDEADARQMVKDQQGTFIESSSDWADNDDAWEVESDE